jgi:hypothetical protein
MSQPVLVEVANGELARRIGRHVYLGRAFAFIEPSAFDQAGEAWTGAVTGITPGRPCVVPLAGAAGATLPGVRLRLPDLPPLRLTSITSDKSLYREGRDRVHLFALDAAAGGREKVLEIQMAGSQFARRTVTLDAFGCGTLALGDLPAGEFAVRWQDAPAEEPSCEFTVAEYRLAPLVASLVERSLAGQPPRLKMTLRLETFGVPVHGAVRLELLDRNTRVAETHADVKHGVVHCAFELTGEGPHAVNVQMAGDPSRTATVPIIGSRKSERSRTVFSRLGQVVVGSLLPGDDTREVRGIYLSEEGVTTAPFQLERVDTETSQLRVLSAATALRILTLAPGGAAATGCEPCAVIARDAVAAGETLAIATPGPVAFLAIGAFVGGRPWEGWAAVVHPSRLAPRIRVPEQATPGEEVALEVTGDACDRGSVYLVVKDARLPSADSPANRLAGQIKRVVEWAPIGQDDPPGPLIARLPPPPRPVPVYSSSAFGTRRLGGLLDFVLETVSTRERSLHVQSFTSSEPPLADSLLTALAPAAYDSDSFRDDEDTVAAGIVAGAVAEAEPEQPEAILRADETAADSAPPPAEEAEVLFAGLLPVEQGRAGLTLRLGRAFTEYVVEAFLTTGRDWAAAEARFRATKDVYAELQLPAFVHHGDGAIGHVHAGSATGRFRVRLARDGETVPLVRDGVPVAADEVLEARHAALSFLAVPGDYEALVADVDRGTAVRDRGRVELPGKLRRVARTVRFLQPGESLSQDEDAAIRQLTVLPGLDRPLRALVRATADYGHLCCEQTAAKMLAAAAMYALSGDDPGSRAEAEAILLAGVRREATMWLRGKGFKMYPESPNEPHAYYGPKAARYLHYVELLRDVDGRLQPELRDAIDEAAKMARDAAAAYRLDWPPVHPANCEEAYAALRFGGGAARDRALALARQQEPRGTAPADRDVNLGGAVALRCELAYAAATLFRGSQVADFPKALGLANRVVADLDGDGRLYSTVDSVAAIALLAEMHAVHVLGAAGRVRADDHERVTREAALAGPVRRIQALEGTVGVEVLRNVEEDWGAFAAAVPLQVSLLCRGAAKWRFTVSDGIDLVVRLTEGYRDGDMVWVCLPDALTRVVGGGQVKRFVIDFRGQDEVRIPLAATAVTLDCRARPAAQRFAVCVRNMFEEERAGNPGLLEVQVVPSRAAGHGLLEAEAHSVKALASLAAEGP